MKVSNKTTTILLGILVAVITLLITAPEPELSRFADHKGDSPIGSFNMPTHLVKIP